MDGGELTTFALIFMSTSMLAVTVLAVYCYYRILTTPTGSKKRKASSDGPPIVL